ncbi:MAG: energy-coupling factor ABC transporter ATP-binding protein [Planctomycetota bacterium]|jgi:cobalt/nickel transport system ATP-binding protein
MAKAVEIQDFSYHYPDGTCALNEMSLSIENGQRVVMIGPNGAGKSTLLLAMAGFINGSGKVFIDGFEVKKANLKRIRSIIGSCLENPDDQLFMPTLFDDVAFGPLNMGFETNEVKERVDEALRIVGLGGMVEKAPHHLSAGQKRAAAIATILSMSPQIITFDEPDGNLDPANRNNLIKILGGLSQTLIVATCNMNFAFEVGERVVLINNGKIIADGDAKEVMLDSELMTKHGLEVPSTVK